MAGLVDALMLFDATQQLSNRELADYLVNHVWADKTFGTPEETLLSETIERLDDDKDLMRRDLRKGILPDELATDFHE